MTARALRLEGAHRFGGPPSLWPTSAEPTRPAAARSHESPRRLGCLGVTVGRACQKCPMPKSSTKSPAKVAAFSNASDNWQMAVFDLSKMQGAAPIPGAALTFVLVSYASMRRLGLSVNERVLLCAYYGLSAGETLDDNILLVENSAVSFEKSLVGRVWPSTMTTGATALIDEASRSRLGQQYGGQVALARFEPLVSCLGVASRIFLSSFSQAETPIKIGTSAGIVLAHQLSELNLRQSLY